MMKRFLAVPAAAGSILLCLLAPSGALAGETATVTVRVEGEAKTLLSETEVTTNTTPVYKEGKEKDACPGTNAIGALQDATDGDWSGKWDGGSIKNGKFDGLGYTVETILGESHPLGTPFWGFFLNNRFSESAGPCKAELEPGDSILYAPVSGGTPSPLQITAPESAQAGEAVPVTVTAYEPSKGQPKPAAGATISYQGKTAQTEAEGHATVTLEGSGPTQLTVTAPESIRDETTVCVYPAGEKCGSPDTGSPGGNQGQSGVAGYTAGSSPQDTGTTALPGRVTALLTSIRSGRTYRRGHAPRLLAGHVSAPSAVVSVSLSLDRSYKGRCYAYEGARERFERARCGRRPFFSAGSGADFSYLLPGALQPGRYVLELKARDAAGAVSKLALGSTEVVFHVS